MIERAQTGAVLQQSHERGGQRVLSTRWFYTVLCFTDNAFLPLGEVG